MPNRRIVSIFLSLGVLVAPAVAAPPPAAAILSECNLLTEVCATLTVSMGGEASGNFATYGDQFHLNAVGINCSQFIDQLQGTCSYRYTLYAIGATPKTRTLYWSSIADSKSITCVEGCGTHLASLSGSITLSANQSAVIHAYYDPKDPKGLAVGKNGTGSGTVSALYPGGIHCGATCSWTYDSSYTVELVATPDDGSTFDGWAGSCSGTGECFAAMSANRSVTATFSKVATPPPVSTPQATPVVTPKPSSTPPATPPATPRPSATAIATPRGSTMPSHSPVPGATAQPAATNQPKATGTGAGTTAGPGAAGHPSADPADPAATGGQQQDPNAIGSTQPTEFAIAGSTLAPLDTATPDESSTAAPDGGPGLIAIGLAGLLIVLLAATVAVSARSRRSRAA